MISNITRRKGKSQGIRIKVAMLIFVFLGLLLYSLFFIQPVSAIIDPLAVPNNKFGVHIIQATPDESSPAATLVNTNGDWGYITVLIESRDRNQEKWQEFFNDLRRRHLIPLIRLATHPEGNPSTRSIDSGQANSGQAYWKRPYEGEEEAWADFLDSLNWPTKNRYVIIYNEPNHSKEWGNKVDATNYAKVLDQTITALKKKNGDFFVLNAGFDASAPSKPPEFEDEIIFMKNMNKAVPGIFEKLDGWVSHSYPNPDFKGLPDGVGRGTVRTYSWEMQQLRSLGVIKNLPIFITETGWKHAEGLDYDPRLPDEDTVSKYYKEAFKNAWNNDGIVAITPFLLNYQEFPFDHFSFKRLDPEYYSMYQMMQDLSKVAGKPVQEAKAEFTKGEIFSSMVTGETYTTPLTFKNVGQSIWNDRNQIRLAPVEGGQKLGISTIELPLTQKIEPGQEYTFNLNLKAPQTGTFKVSLNLFEGQQPFNSEPVEFSTKVKSPVILKIKGALLWKEDFVGNYILTVKGPIGDRSQNITLDKNGYSPEIEARYLLPDYSFNFALEKPFYLPSLLRQTVYTGVNTLDFGKLKPDILTAIFNPLQLWKLLPSSK